MTPTCLEFCFLCAEFYTEAEWQADCETHLPMQLQTYGSITYRHTIVRPAFCLVCIQSETLSPGDRMRHWERDADAIRHIDSCHGWRWACAQCRFQCEDRRSGRYHLQDAHGYHLRLGRRVDEVEDSQASSPTAPGGSSGDLKFESSSEASTDEPKSKFGSFPTTHEPGLSMTLLPSPWVSTDAAATDMWEHAASIEPEGCSEESTDELMSMFISFPPTPVTEPSQTEPQSRPITPLQLPLVSTCAFPNVDDRIPAEARLPKAGEVPVIAVLGASHPPYEKLQIPKDDGFAGPPTVASPVSNTSPRIVPADVCSPNFSRDASTMSSSDSVGRQDGGDFETAVSGLLVQDADSHPVAPNKRPRIKLKTKSALGLAKELQPVGGSGASDILAKKPRIILKTRRSTNAAYYAGLHLAENDTEVDPLTHASLRRYPGSMLPQRASPTPVRIKLNCRRRRPEEDSGAEDASCRKKRRRASLDRP